MALGKLQWYVNDNCQRGERVVAMTEWDIGRVAIGQSNLQVVLCDDDDLFLDALTAELERVFHKLHIGAEMVRFHSDSDLLQTALATCSMVFFDIDFEDEAYTGIDLARKLRQVNRRALVFFVTNFIEYAPAGYEVQAFRYILKRDMGEVLERYIMQAVEQLAEGQECLHLRDKEETVALALNDIVYLEVMDHSVSIHTPDGLYTLSATLSALEQRLETRGFLRIHKSYLVNMRSIRKFRSRECLLSDGTTLAVSERNYAQQKQKYLLWKGLT